MKTGNLLAFAAAVLTATVALSCLGDRLWIEAEEFQPHTSWRSAMLFEMRVY